MRGTGGGVGVDQGKKISNETGRPPREAASTRAGSRGVGDTGSHPIAGVRKETRRALRRRSAKVGQVEARRRKEGLPVRSGRGENAACRVRHDAEGQQSSARVERHADHAWLGLRRIVIRHFSVLIRGHQRLGARAVPESDRTGPGSAQTRPARGRALHARREVQERAILRETLGRGKNDRVTIRSATKAPAPLRRETPVRRSSETTRAVSSGPGRKTNPASKRSDGSQKQRGGASGDHPSSAVRRDHRRRRRLTRGQRRLERVGSGQLRRHPRRGRRPRHGILFETLQDDLLDCGIDVPGDARGRRRNLLRVLAHEVRERRSIERAAARMELIEDEAREHRDRSGPKRPCRSTARAPCRPAFPKRLRRSRRREPGRRGRSR